MGDSQKLLQVFVNLLGNARDASPAGEVVDIHSVAAEEHLLISVTDRGYGIPEAIQGQIFEPFFTTKDTGEGTGLGLALVYSILEDLQGRIQVESPVASTGIGTCFRLEIVRGEYDSEYQ
jgi:signal transduction histidine kinase